MSEFGLNPGEEGGGFEDQSQQQLQMEDAAEPTLEIDLDEIENQNPEKQLTDGPGSEKQLRNQSSQILCK
jgi:hypothetical protein